MLSKGDPSTTKCGDAPDARRSLVTARLGDERCRWQPRAADMSSVESDIQRDWRSRPTMSLSRQLETLAMS